MTTEMDLTDPEPGLALLSRPDRDRRLEALRAALGEAGCDALVVTKPQNVRWLTGFTGSAGTVVVTGTGLTVITDDRYRTQVAEQLEAAAVEAQVVINRDLAEPLRTAIGSTGRPVVGLEAGQITWARQREIVDWLGEGATVEPTLDLIEGLRRCKDPSEIERLTAAAAIADRALAEVAPRLGSGLSEQQVARLLERAMFDRGADGLSFPTIVATGTNSAKPHAVPSDRVISPGDAVVIDFGASVDGYGSDMTRTFLIDPVPEALGAIYDAVAEAQRAGVAAVGPGVEEQAVDAACRSVLEGHGLGAAFVHGTGHGLGLEIHEQPILSSRATGILQEGYVVTVEPGAYLPHLGGVRIEDSVVITGEGARPITRFPKDHRVPTR
jgi:Xaa-Pro aminopeptidase